MLKGRHLLDLIDYTPEEITYLLELSKKLKKMKHIKENLIMMK